MSFRGLVGLVLLAACVPPPPVSPAPTMGLVATRGCDRGDGEACLVLAEMYAHGRTYPRDRRKAANTYARACYFKSPRSCRVLADFFRAKIEVPQTPGDAATLYEQACLWGDAPACRALSQMAERGDGTVRDLGHAASLRDRALLLMRADCSQGSFESCDQLADMYAAGEGVAKDETRAIEMRHAACVAGGVTACRHAGTPELARPFLETECAAGDSLACHDVSSVYQDEAMKAAARQQACDGGFGESCRELAESLGGDAARADPLYARAAAIWTAECDAHYDDACVALAHLYASGKGAVDARARALPLVQNMCDDRDEWACGELKELTAPARP